MPHQSIFLNFCGTKHHFILDFFLNVAQKAGEAEGMISWRLQAVTLARLHLAQWEP